MGVWLNQAEATDLKSVGLTTVWVRFPLPPETLNQDKMEEEQPKLNGSPEFYKMLDDMSSIHNRKSYDYAQASNPFSNFEKAGEIASWFKHPVDIAFAALIGVKLARIAELTSSGKTPNNESLEDTQLDLATYSALWGAWRKTKNDPLKP